MIRWMIYGLIFLGSALMVFNIYGFVRYARFVNTRRKWESGRAILYIPIVLLSLFLIGYPLRRGRRPGRRRTGSIWW